MFTSHPENLVYKVKGIFLQGWNQVCTFKMYLRSEKNVEKYELWLICNQIYFIQKFKILSFWENIKIGVIIRSKFFKSKQTKTEKDVKRVWLPEWLKTSNFLSNIKKGQIKFTTMAHGNGTKSSESKKQKSKRKDGKELGKSLLKRKKHDLYTSTRHTTDFEQNQGISSMTEQTSIDEFLARYVFEFWKLCLISDHWPRSYFPTTLIFFTF